MDPLEIYSKTIREALKSVNTSVVLDPNEREV